MSRLDELIKNLCPNGVEYRILDEVTHYSKLRISATEVDTNTYVGVENLLQNKQGKTISNNVPTTGKVIRFEEGDILIGNIRPYLKKIWLSNCVGGTNGDVLVIQINNRNILNSKFLYYVLSSDRFFLYDVKNSKGAKMPRGNKQAVMKFVIPVPPLEVQREIVCMLDRYTMLTNELTAKLTAELTARQKQYEYYRDKLLSFKVHGGATNNVCIRTIKTIAKIIRGVRVTKSQLSCNGYPVYQNALAPMGYYNKYNVLKNTTYIISAGAAGEIGFSSENFWAADDCFVFIDLKGVISKYIYYFLMTKRDYIKSRVRKASVPRLSREVIENLEMPIPSIEMQKRIVHVLDNFEKICTDLSIGLPAEIAARQKQYEYYRDKLLSFQ